MRRVNRRLQAKLAARYSIDLPHVGKCRVLGCVGQRVDRFYFVYLVCQLQDYSKASVALGLSQNHRSLRDPPAGRHARSCPRDTVTVREDYLSHDER